MENEKDGFENCDEDFFLGQNLALFKTGPFVQAIKLSTQQFEILQNLQKGLTVDYILETVEIEDQEMQDLFSKIRKYALFIKSL